MVLDSAWRDHAGYRRVLVQLSRVDEDGPTLPQPGITTCLHDEAPLNGGIECLHVLASGLANARRLVAIIADGDRDLKLPQITTPTLVIHGRADRWPPA